MNGVTIDDFYIIRDNLGLSNAARELGDLTGDGRVDLVDFRQWLDNAPPGVASLAGFGSRVPEPSSALIGGMALGALGLLCRRQAGR
jgi:hypothetical protein